MMTVNSGTPILFYKTETIRSNWTPTVLLLSNEAFRLACRRRYGLWVCDLFAAERRIVVARVALD